MLLQFRPGGNHSKNHSQCFRDSKQWTWYFLENIYFREKNNTSWCINSDTEQFIEKLDLKIKLMLFTYISFDCVF